MTRWIRLGLVVAGLGAMLSCGGGDGGFVPPDTGLSLEHFERIASGGIDDRLNAYPWGVELFDGDGDGTPEIYIGTLANALCMQAGVLSLPPERWQCPNDLWDADDIRPYFLSCLNPAIVFRGTYDEDSASFTWDRVFEPPIDQVIGFRGAKVFKDALYMLSGVRLGTVWKSTDGTSWAPASPPTMGLTGGFRGAVEFDGKLYVANDTVGEIYASEDPSTDPTSWAPANSRGFVLSGGGTHLAIGGGGATAAATAASITSPDIPLPNLSPLVNGWRVRITSGAGNGQERFVVNHVDNTLIVQQGPFGQAFDPVPAPGDTFEIVDPVQPDNGPSWTLEVFNGYLYASTVNPYEGTILWRSSDPQPGNWEKVIEGGYYRPGGSVFASLRTYRDHLYIGSLSYPLYYENGLEDAEACEVLRLDLDDQVDVLVGDERPPGTPGTDGGFPLSGIEAGFAQPSNLYAWRTAVHDDGWLYVGTCDFASMLRDYRDAGTGVIPPEYEDLIDLYVGPSGFDLYRTRDGIAWTRISTNGFGENDSYGVRNFLTTPWGLLVCVANAVDGFELWLGKR